MTPEYSLTTPGAFYPEYVLTGLAFENDPESGLEALFAPFFVGPPGPAGGSISTDPENIIGLGNDGGVYASPPQLTSAQW